MTNITYFNAELKKETEKAIQVSVRFEFFDSRNSMRTWSFWLPKSRISFKMWGESRVIVDAESWLIEKAVSAAAEYYNLDSDKGCIESESVMVNS